MSGMSECRDKTVVMLQRKDHDRWLSFLCACHGHFSQRKETVTDGMDFNRYSSGNKCKTVQQALYWLTLAYFRALFFGAWTVVPNQPNNFLRSPGMPIYGCVEPI